VNVMGESIEQGAGEPLRADDLSQVLERQVPGNRRGRAFIVSVEDLKQHLGADFDSGTKPSSSTISSSELADAFEKMQ